MKAAIKATLVFFGFPGMLWALVAFPLAREIAQWVLAALVLVGIWGALFCLFDGAEE